MKQFILLIISACLALYACSSLEEPPTHTSPNDLHSARLVKALDEYNASLEASSVVDSRRFTWNGKTVWADFRGALTYGLIGMKLGTLFGPHGPLAGAIVGGVAGAVGESMYSATPSHPNRPAITKEWMAQEIMVLIVNAESLSAPSDTTIKLHMDIRYLTTAEYVGQRHNLILSALYKNAYRCEARDPEEAISKMSEVEKGILLSDEFNNFFINDIDEALGWAENPFVEEKTEIDVISNRLYKALTRTNVLVSVTDVVNDYIEIIEENSTLSNEEKQVLYSAMSVLAYSNIYWNSGDDIYDVAM